MSYISRLADRIGHARNLSKFSGLIVSVDKVLGKATKERFALGQLGGVPMARLHVRGWRTGEERMVTLQYTAHGDSVILVGSNWGGETHPLWTKNLIANPDCSVTIRGRTTVMRAHLAEGPERDELWRALTAAWPAYQKYQDGVARQLRIFLLTPT